jgi:hypothetical protein
MKRCTQLFIAVLSIFIISCGEQTKVETASTPEVVHLTAENGKPLGPEIKYMPEWKAFGWLKAKYSVEL